MKKKETAAAAPRKTAVKKAVTRRTRKTTEPIVLTWDDIATRAYYIHLESGGDPVDNWLRAERELQPA
jgi:hypothetical protein